MRFVILFPPKTKYLPKICWSTMVKTLNILFILQYLILVLLLKLPRGVYSVRWKAKPGGLFLHVRDWPSARGRSAPSYSSGDKGRTGRAPDVQCWPCVWGRVCRPGREQPEPSGRGSVRPDASPGSAATRGTGRPRRAADPDLLGQELRQRERQSGTESTTLMEIELK